MHLRVEKMLICALGLALVVGTRGRAFSCDPPYGGWYEPCSMPCPCMAAPSSYGCQATCCSPCACVVAPPCGCSSPTTPAGGAGTTSAATTTPGGGDAGTTTAGTTDAGAGTTGTTTAATTWSDADIAKVKAALKDKGISGADADKLIQGDQDVKDDPDGFAKFIKEIDPVLTGDKARDIIQHSYLDLLKKKMEETTLLQAPTSQSVTLHSNPGNSADALPVSTPSQSGHDTARVPTATYYYTLMPVPTVTTASVAQE